MDSCLVEEGLLLVVLRELDREGLRRAAAAHARRVALVGRRRRRLKLVLEAHAPLAARRSSLDDSAVGARGAFAGCRRRSPKRDAMDEDRDEYPWCGAIRSCSTASTTAPTIGVMAAAPADAPAAAATCLPLIR